MNNFYNDLYSTRAVSTPNFRQDERFFGVGGFILPFLAGAAISPLFRPYPMYPPYPAAYPTPYPAPYPVPYPYPYFRPRFRPRPYY